MHRSLAVALGIALVAAGCHRRSSSATLAWQGTIPAGHWLRVRNITGPITVERSTTGQVEIAARPSGRGSVRRIRYAQNRVGDDLVVCTMYGPGGSCTPERYHTSSPSHWWWPFQRSAGVAYTIRVPAGVKVDAHDVSGSLKISGASADVIAKSVNGGIEVASDAGPVHAETVNGSIRIRVDSVGSDLSAQTVNGAVRLTLPATLAASVELETVNGAINSDFPLTAKGKYGPKHASGTVGAGGHAVKVETVNGSVTLQKAS